MYFKPYYLGCLAHASYLIGGSSGDAAVIDPRRDIDEYVADAEAAGLQIRHVIETHLHADFVSGHVELARRTGATIHVGANANAAFPHHPIQEGDEISLGDVNLRFLETPGHTPEDISVVAQVKGESEPRMVFTGDTLFIGDVGRPDLAGLRADVTEIDMARAMYRSLETKLLKLPDSTEVWPAHGAGSACGRSLSDDRVSTIGREKEKNSAVKLVLAGDEEGFLRYDVEGLPAVPRYFRHDALTNRAGAKTLDEVMASVRPLSSDDVRTRIEEGALVLDTRSIDDFGAGHLPGSIHIQLEGMFAPWVGAVIPPDAKLVVVADAGREGESIMRLARVGYEGVIGWLEGGLDAWESSGETLEALSQLSPQEIQRRIASKEPLTVLDVRTHAEFERGHVDGALNVPLASLQDRLGDIPNGHVAVMCRTGYRSSIASSLLQRAGVQEIVNISGGWSGWVGDCSEI